MHFSRKITAVTATALALGLMTGMPAKVQAQGAHVEGPQVTWRFSAWGTRRPFTEGIEAVAAHVAERTGGNFTINIVYGGQLSNPRENLDGIELGAFPMAMFCSSYHPAKHPSVMVLDLPFLPLPDLETTMAVHEAVFSHPQVAEEFAQWNAMLYMSAIIPQYELIGAGEPPQSLEDFRGKRVRALGGLGRAMSEIGATPTPVPPTDLYTSMGGVIDATMFPVASSLAFRLHEVSTWFTSDMSPGTLNCPTVIGKRAFDALPPQYQELLMEAKAIGYEALIAANEAGTVEALELFEQTMTRVSFSDEEMDAFRAAAGQPIWEAWVEENEAAGRPGRELLDLVLSTAARGGN